MQSKITNGLRKITVMGIHAIFAALADMLNKEIHFNFRILKDSLVKIRFLTSNSSVSPLNPNRHG